MRENRTYGSEGGAAQTIESSLPLSANCHCLPLNAAAKQWHEDVGMKRQLLIRGSLSRLVQQTGRAGAV